LFGNSPARFHRMKAFAQRVFVAGVVIGAIILTAYVMQWLLLVLGGVLMAILFRTAAEWLSGRTNSHCVGRR
jgi:hypothetical protein